VLYGHATTHSQDSAAMRTSKGTCSSRSAKPAYRPRVLTDSVVPPTTPPHGSEKLGLFLFRNGFSTEPVTALVPRDRLCKSKDTIAGVLSSRAGEHFGCDGACRVFLANGW
jgi:hypothetical protein